ncbi:acyltransferase [Bacillus sp. ISL-18]|uniref:acyltransferase n=1 Tax=Bacillus sp. ISL-18 TaxID=2819118 RepID=UPI001BE85221|nr:acyltransferase [Bacillus sp. ISL-18]MBT2658618.1 acyltransferase [Bacillus sp. ISL-18]
MKRGVIWYADNNCTLEIGDGTTIMEAGISVVEPNGKISIGEDCMFSFGIDILNSDSHSIIDLTSNKRINFSKDVVIGNHVWIGHEVQILKGTEIVDNSIVGSRSILTKKYGSNCVIVGTPAKQVKENVTWDRNRLYN